MKTLILTRTHILTDCMKGYMQIEGENFSCYTLEAKCPYDAKPLNRIFQYAFDCGEYEFILKPYKFYPFLPFFKAKPYINPSFVQQDNVNIRPGCIAIGTNFASERLLTGFDVVADAIVKLIYKDYDEWKHGKLIIKDDPDIYISGDDYEEEKDDDDFNFLNL